MESSEIKSNLLKFYTALFLRAFLLLSPVMLLFYQENGLNYKHLFLFQGIFYLTSIIVEFPIGYISDNHSRRNLLLGSLGLFLGITTLWLFFHGFWIILLGEILFAVSKVMLDNATSAYLYDYLNQNNLKQDMAKYYGYVNFYLALGTAVAAIIGALLYSNYGSPTVLVCEFIFILLGMYLVNSLPDIRSCLKKHPARKERLKKFGIMTKEIYKNPAIKYYIYYSGLFTSFSILFAISFQPLMQRALFPIFMFGVIAFFNHGIRALSGVFAGKFQQKINIRSMIIPLYMMYLTAFMIIFLICNLKNIFAVTALIIIICLIIGFQLLFTILHVSRLHKFVDIENRGNLMAINNTVSRGISAIVLISSKLLMDKMDLTQFYICAFVIFILLCTYFMVKTYRIPE